jgi:hypothetical protein
MCAEDDIVFAPHAKVKITALDLFHEFGFSE